MNDKLISNGGRSNGGPPPIGWPSVEREDISGAIDLGDVHIARVDDEAELASNAENIPRLRPHHWCFMNHRERGAAGRNGGVVALPPRPSRGREFAPVVDDERPFRHRTVRITAELAKAGEESDGSAY